MRYTSILAILFIQASSVWMKSDQAGPSPRYIQNMVSTGHGIYLFGGKSNVNDGLNDLWTWSDNVWKKLKSGTTPRWDCPIVYDSHLKQLLVFGGRSLNESDKRVELNDTWRFKENNWYKLDIAGPPSRSSHAMAFHSKTKQTILFGGRNDQGILNDTWSFNGEKWHMLESKGPGKRMGHTLVENKSTGDLYLFGGHDGNNLLNDLWKFDGKSWWKIENEISPSQRMAHTMTFDENGNGILFGGWDGDVNDETWILSDEQWKLLKTSDSPEARLSGALAFDPETKNFILFGGSSDFGSGFHSGTWKFSLKD